MRYPDKYLAGVGVAGAETRAGALPGETGREQWLPGFIKVAAIGTLADDRPAGRRKPCHCRSWVSICFCREGPHKIGLRSLLDISGLSGKTIGSYHIAFLLAPRVNAAGRMSTPDLATRLLLANDEAMADEARSLAMQARWQKHVRRQREEATILAKRKDCDERSGCRCTLGFGRVAGEGWHRGVVGIVASKLVDAFHRPAIVLSIEDGIAQGSCREVSQCFDMLAGARALRPFHCCASAVTGRRPVSVSKPNGIKGVPGGCERRCR